MAGKCRCSRYAIVVNEDERRIIGCVDEPHGQGRFAPGHDSKLRGLLIEAGGEGLQVERTFDDGEVETTDAVEAAKSYGFAHLVAQGVERARRRNQRVAPEDVQPGPAVARVGRNEFKGEIGQDGRFHFERDGEQVKTARYTVVSQ